MNAVHENGPTLPFSEITSVKRVRPAVWTDRFQQVVGERYGYRLPRRRLDAAAEVAQLMAEQYECGSIDEYLLRIHTEPLRGPLNQSLIHALTRRQKRFFNEPFGDATLVTCVLPSLERAATEPHQLQVWCPGCATGEDAYSLAMVLNEAFGDTRTVSVVGTDINCHQLRHARRARYCPWSVANLDATRIEEYFTCEPKFGDFVVRPEIQQIASFSFANPAEGELPSRRPFDLVDARGWTVRSSAEATNRAFETFHRALSPSGILLLSSEDVLPSEGWTWWEAAEVVICQPSAAGERFAPPPEHQTEGDVEAEFVERERSTNRLLAQARRKARLGQPEAAFLLAQKAARKELHHAECHEVLAEIFLQFGRRRQAIQELSLALYCNPARPEPYVLQAELQASRGANRQAAHALRSALALISLSECPSPEEEGLKAYAEEQLPRLFG